MRKLILLFLLILLLYADVYVSLCCFLFPLFPNDRRVHGVAPSTRPNHLLPNKVRRSQFGRGIIIAEHLHSEQFGLLGDGGASNGSGGGGGVGAASAAADAATFRAACSRLALAIMNCWNFRFFAA